MKSKKRLIYYVIIYFGTLGTFVKSDKKYLCLHLKKKSLILYKKKLPRFVL